jgi:hypothetical protein
MKIEQSNWTASAGWKTTKPSPPGNISPQFVFVFSSGKLLNDPTIIAHLHASYKDAKLIGCSTAGEICGTRVSDNSVSVTAVELENTRVEFISLPVNDASQSFECGKDLIKKFKPEGLRHIFLLSDGLNVNGSELVRGLKESLPEGVSITGGLAGDGADFKETFILSDAGAAISKCVSAIGFYGDRLQIGFGSFGGWDSFGIDRKVTKSKGNVLFQIDDQPALELYKSFLGEKASELPASGLLFPLSLRTKPDELPVVRTILAVNEEDQSITFAGDLPEGAYVKLMKANTDRLIDGAVKAAQTIMNANDHKSPQLAILISCVGRKLVLKQLIEEEVEGAASILGNETVLTGFYSYGEISPFSNETSCELHNQTMTITTLSEN